jgi:hypothetical protein
LGLITANGGPHSPRMHTQVLRTFSHVWAHHSPISQTPPQTEVVLSLLFICGLIYDLYKPLCVHIGSCSHTILQAYCWTSTKPVRCYDIKSNGHPFIMEKSLWLTYLLKCVLVKIKNINLKFSSHVLPRFIHVASLPLIKLSWELRLNW